ncbi:MAG TPA: hypothetical protein VM165_14580 [Planctomycetaceae bacterium]|nr:hypothetical protein [Planctomycetaceae bacterium]
MRPAMRWDRPRYVSLALRGPTKVLWKLPASYRVLSYGDVAQEERRHRWIARRWAAAVVLLVASYVLASGPWLAAVRTNAIPSAGLPARIIGISFLPVNLARFECQPFHWALVPYDRLCDSLFTKQSLAGGWRPNALWWTWVGVWAAVAYVLSPVPVWFAACLCAIERQPGVALAMSVVFAPLSVLADFSRTVREFYETYGDWQEALD